jgi:hypothetical protein
MDRNYSNSKDSIGNRPTYNSNQPRFTNYMQSNVPEAFPDDSSEFSLLVQFPVSSHRFFESLSKEKCQISMVSLR